MTIVNLRRVFGVDGWQWSNATPADCGKRMVLRTVVLGPPASTTVVRGLLHSRGPPWAGEMREDRVASQ